VSKLSAKKSCNNAKLLGHPLADGKELLKIETLTQCLRAVNGQHGQNAGCSAHFEMNVETGECSCMPTGSVCAEKDHKKVCRFNLAVRGKEESVLLETEADFIPPASDPCSDLGCNSAKGCTWITGEVVRRLSSQKTCGQSKLLGHLKADGKTLLKIETLSDCLHAVHGKAGKDAGCSPEFEMNAESGECSCRVAGDECAEQDHAQVCRFSFEAHDPVTYLREAALLESGGDNPCSSLGCNSHKCSWVSGEVVSKLTEKKACSNAKLLGHPEADGTNLLKIETLTECIRAVHGKAGQDKGCGKHFEMNAETNHCSCIASGGQCEEQDHEKVCRFNLVEY
jgi:hypothetical protein